MTVFVASLIGLVSGVASGAFGIGGALLTTPGIRILLHTPARMSVGTTLPVVIPAAIVGLIAYVRDDLVDIRLATTAALSGASFAVLGAYLTQFVPGETLMIITAALILAMSIKMLPIKGGVPQPQIHPGVAVYLLVGALSGFVSGLLGLGGGLILVPVFTVLLRIPVKTALGTSLAVVAAQAIPGTVVHALLHNIDWTVAAGLAIGVIPGARVGSKLAVRADDRKLRLIVGIGMAVLAVFFGASEIRNLMAGA